MRTAQLIIETYLESEVNELLHHWTTLYDQGTGTGNE